MHSCLEHALIAKKSPNRFDNKFIKFLLDVRPVEQKNSQFIYLLTYSAQIFCFTGHPVEIFIVMMIWAIYLTVILIEWCLKPCWCRHMWWWFLDTVHTKSCATILKSPFINKRNSNINLFTQCHYTNFPLRVQIDQDQDKSEKENA